MPTETDVVIVGGGLAGLAAARRLHRAGVPWRLVEAGDRLGGRVATDAVDGYLLDRGFQVLNTAYPRLGTLLDLGTLDLGGLPPGSWSAGATASTGWSTRCANPAAHQPPRSPASARWATGCASPRSPPAAPPCRRTGCSPRRRPPARRPCAGPGSPTPSSRS